MNGKIRLVALLTALLMLFQTIALAEVVTTVDDYNTLLQSRIEQFVNGTPEVQYAILMALATDEQRESMIALLSEEQRIALDKYVIALDPPVYKTVNFTHAGPFMPPVDVSGIARMRLMRTAAYSNDNTAVDNESVYTSKVVSGNATDGYKLRLETYVTGQTIVDKVEKSIPVDIVLVLDQSGSMAYDFSGNKTNTNTDRRQYAMKNAVNGFISSVAEKYNAVESDHRIAIVTFSSNASSLQGWTYVDAVGSNTLHDKINELPDSPSGATNVAAGMSEASTLLDDNDGYKYTGQNTQRQKVVIVFTDGVPTTNTDFDTSVANSAIETAKSLKDKRITVYSLGIFNGANPDQLHGEKWDYTVYDDVPCDGSVGSYWGGSWLSSIVGRNDFDVIDIAAGNRFLNYLSSNTPSARNVGLERGNFNPSGKIGGDGTGYKITENFNKENGNYYLTAGNAESLDKMFQRISNNIQTGQASIELGTKTVVKDIIADSFQLPPNADKSSIKVYTSDYTSTGSWTSDQEANYPVSIDGNTVSVTGFNFSLYYVDEKRSQGRDENDPDKSGDFYGRKLIIEIPIEVREGFLGGNNVPTNGDNSGVYSGTTCIENFEMPHVNVPIAPITVTAPDKNVYLLDTLTEDALKAGSTVKCGDVKIDLDPKKDNFGLESWQNEFVTIAPSFAPTDSSALNGLTEDTSYTVGCTIKPDTELIGTGVATKQSGSATGNIYVFKPEVTYKDSMVQYLDPVPVIDAYHAKNNFVEVAWKHEDTVADTTVMGNAPALTYTYTPDPTPWVTAGKVTSTQDVNVNVTFAINNTPVNDYTTTVREACVCNGQNDINCTHTTKFSDLANNHNPEFVVHVYDVLTSLTISKEGMDAIDAGQSFLFRVTGDNLPAGGLLIAINGNSSETISGLLVGSEYTVVEEENWSWRYTDKAPGQKITLKVSGKDNKVTVTNKRDQVYWLDGDCYAENVFNAQGTGN